MSEIDRQPAWFEKYLPFDERVRRGLVPDRMTIHEIAKLHPMGDRFADLLLDACDACIVELARQLRDDPVQSEGWGLENVEIPGPGFGRGLRFECVDDPETLLRVMGESTDLYIDPVTVTPRHPKLILIHRDDLKTAIEEMGLPLPEDAPLRAWWPGEKAPPAISIEDALTREQLRQIELRWLFKVLELTTSTADPFEVLTALLGRGLDLTAQVGDQGDEQRVRPEDVSAALAEAGREYRALQDARFDGTAIDEWKREAEIWKRPVAVGEHHMALGELRVSESNYATACLRLGLSAYAWPKVHWPRALADLDERRCSDAPRPGETIAPTSADAAPAGAKVEDPETGEHKGRTLELRTQAFQVWLESRQIPK